MGGLAGGSLSLLAFSQKTSRLLRPPYPPICLISRGGLISRCAHAGGQIEQTLSRAAITQGLIDSAARRPALLALR